MTIYVAFLRAINVGGHTVKMERLKTLFGELGLEQIETFIASGNVLFDTPKRIQPATLELLIEDHLADVLGYPVETFLRTPAELAKIAAVDPFGPSAIGEGDTLQIGMLKLAPPPDVAKRVAALSNGYDRLTIIGRELYWLTHGRISDSKIKPNLFARTLGVLTTMRNRTTIATLAGRTAP